MVSVLESAYSRVIDDKSFLGQNEDSTLVEKRFAFLEAHKRDQSGRFVQKTVGSGEQAKKLDAFFRYMLDRSNGHLYILHTPDELPQYFMMSALVTPIVFTATLAWNVAVIVAEAVNGMFEVFQDVYPERHGEGVTTDLIKRLRNKMNEKCEQVLSRLRWIKQSALYAIGIEAAAVSALKSSGDPDHLFAMKVVIGRIEYLWNRQQDFRQSFLSQFNHFNRKVEERLAKTPDANRGDVSLKYLKQLDLPALRSIFYIMQCFQSLGQLNENVREGVRKFEGIEGSLKETYPEFSIYLEERRKAYQDFLRKQGKDS